ncbi:hypothetical protein [Frankia sp. ACN1ag]|nr:hypothetical protein [Frankia sp. ACN1ag]
MADWSPSPWKSDDGVSWRLVAALVILTAVVSIAAGSWLGWISHAYF